MKACLPHHPGLTLILTDDAEGCKLWLTDVQSEAYVSYQNSVLNPRKVFDGNRRLRVVESGEIL